MHFLIELPWLAIGNAFDLHAALSIFLCWTMDISWKWQD